MYSNPPSRGARFVAATGLGLVVCLSLTGSAGFKVAVTITVTAGLFGLSELIALVRKGDTPKTEFNFEPKVLIAAFAVALAGFVLGVLSH